MRKKSKACLALRHSKAGRYSEHPNEKVDDIIEFRWPMMVVSRQGIQTQQ